MKRKINIGINESRNYSSVKLEVLDEEIEFENDEEFNAKCRVIYNILRAEIDLQFRIIEHSKNNRGDK